MRPRMDPVRRAQQAKKEKQRRKKGARPGSDAPAVSIAERKDIRAHLAAKHWDETECYHTGAELG